MGLTIAIMGRWFLPLGGMVSPGSDYGHWVWTVWTVNESIRHGENPYFTPRIYFPVGAHLAKHTLAPGVFPLTFAVDVMTGHDPMYPVYAYRLAIGVSLALALGLVFLFLHDLGFPWWVGVPIGIEYAFSSFTRWHAANLNQVTAVALVPLTGIALVAAYRQPTRRRLMGLALVGGLGIYFTEMIVFIWLAVLLLSLAALSVSRARQGLVEWARRLRSGPLITAALVFVLSVVPFALQWRASGGKAPKDDQTYAFSANALGFVVPHPGDNVLYSPVLLRLPPLLWKRLGPPFLGYPLLACALVGLFAALKGRLDPRESAWVKAAAIVAGSFLVLSLGPQLRVGFAATGLPLPYALLMRIPPFSMGRTPMRLVLLALIFLAVVGAAGLRFLATRLRTLGQAAAVGLWGLVTFWALGDVYHKEPVAAVYTPPTSLSTVRPGPVVNIPISFADGFAAFLQVFHGQPIATGYISRRSPEQVRYVRELDTMLERDPREFGRTMAARGFRTAILGPGTGEDLATALAESGLTILDLRNTQGVTPPVEGE